MESAITALKRGVNKRPVMGSASLEFHYRSRKSSAAGERICWRRCRLELRRHLRGHNAIALLQSFNDFSDHAVADSGFNLYRLRLAAGQNINCALAARRL